MQAPKNKQPITTLIIIEDRYFYRGWARSGIKGEKKWIGSLDGLETVPTKLFVGQETEHVVRVGPDILRHGLTKYFIPGTYYNILLTGVLECSKV